jgi:hypothetical protein
MSKPPSFISGFLVFGKGSAFLRNFAGKIQSVLLAN